MPKDAYKRTFGFGACSAAGGLIIQHLIREMICSSRFSDSSTMACSRLLLIWMISCFHLICLCSQEKTGFVYNGFRQVDLYLDESAKILPNGLLQLTNASQQQMGHAFFKQPFGFNSSESLSFSTHFVCAMVPNPGGVPGGHGIAFVVSPSMDLRRAQPSRYLGLFNISANGSSSSHLLAIELDTALAPELDDINNNHVGIDVNSPRSVESAPASYFSNSEGRNKSITLLSGDPVQVWVDYKETVLSVSLAPLKVPKPSQPLLSRFINLSEVFQDGRMFVGFSAATGTVTSYQYILGWSFSRSRVLSQDLDISKLPRVPHPRAGHKKSSLLLVALLVLLAILVLVVLAGVYFYWRNKYAEVREAWEKEFGPYRFSYKSLYKATKGFSKDGFLGKGGFGEVYRGTLPLSREIAVKRVFHDGEQGMKQFVAEIMSMRSLKHRNLVPLLGYCRRKGELLLVSEYMPNGSLDQYLFHVQKPVLSWSQRLVILKSIASALSYLHAGANQVVLHRDIKASNVMLDAEFNGRLGDFGMARFHDHGANLATTAAVGTIGYVAPELMTMGASTRTDVYAFGVFMLEVTCGRRPVEPEMPVEKRYLIWWVCECWKTTSLLEARDPRLGGDFSYEEAKVVLKLGLLCSNLLPESRPTMEQVVQYLNGNIPLPDFSPYSPGIGAFTPVGIDTTTLAVCSSAPSTSSSSASNSYPDCCSSYHLQGQKTESENHLHLVEELEKPQTISPASNNAMSATQDGPVSQGRATLRSA